MDKMKGKGSTRWPSGRKHVGNYDDDTAHGKGKECLLDGTNYFGQFKAGKASGHGVY